MAAKSKPKKRRPKAKREKPVGSPNKKESICPIVGIGGSAGAFEAATELLRHLPVKSNLAFVVVQHMDPHHTSQLANLLGKVTDMPVIELKSRTKPKPGTVYVQPPNKCVIVEKGALSLIPRSERLNLAIDHFFESLAETCGSRAIGIILSGTGSDGTAGLGAIKAAGGLTFAQDEASAKFSAMPRSAIRSGFADAVLSPRRIAREIQRIATHPYIRLADGEVRATEKAAYQQADDLGRIFLSLKKQMGVDFTTYKQSTLLRRIQRRMVLHRIEKLGRYAHFLRDNKKEIESLFGDLLINVTRFFRDDAVFRALKKRFLPALVKRKKKDRHPELRAWVPGCASGEEVYSLAICVLEALGPRASSIRVQIFGTDLSESIIAFARAGIYPSAIEKDVSKARLKRFFTKRDGTYQINRNIRDICTFARQNITADPPFSRLDLISCRNVLIYLGPELHRRCFPQFHYALNPGGYLILGPAESVGAFDGLFEGVDRRNKIYAKKMVATPNHFDADSYRKRVNATSMGRSVVAENLNFGGHLLQMADRIMLSAYAPAAVVIDQDLQVQQFRGRTDLYLEHAPGPATLKLLQLVKPSLVGDLRTAIHRAIKAGKPVRKEGALVKRNGEASEINIEVVPFNLAGSSGKSWLLVIFDETTKGTKRSKLPRLLGRTAVEREVAALRRELSASKQSLQVIIEEQEVTNEELKSANEEIESSNEELQSTNEELETAKEELQSTNEELTTLNEELSTRNLEMMQANADLTNLLSSIHLPIVMVDNALTVRRATPAARQAFNILPTDIGRPLRELRPNVNIDGLEKILRDVIETLSTREREVSDQTGRLYSLRVRPYRTSDNKIDGAVITLFDLDRKDNRGADDRKPRLAQRSARRNKNGRWPAKKAIG